MKWTYGVAIGSFAALITVKTCNGEHTINTRTYYEEADRAGKAR
jgi:hypothetical protein